MAILQIADAVVIARYLRANLVLPDIRGSEPGDKRSVFKVVSAPSSCVGHVMYSSNWKRTFL